MTGVVLDIGMDSGGLTVYRTCTPIVDTRYERDSDDSPMQAIVDAVSAAAGVETVDLPPLYESVDTDAVNQLFEDAVEGAPEKMVLGFEFRAYNVFIAGDGRIRVCDATEPTEPAPVFESASG